MPFGLGCVAHAKLFVLQVTSRSHDELHVKISGAQGTVVLREQPLDRDVMLQFKLAEPHRLQARWSRLAAVLQSV